MTEAGDDECAKRQPRVFLSASWEDQKNIGPLVAGLKQRGLTLVAPTPADPTVSVFGGVQNLVRSADALLVIVSAVSMRSLAVREEIAAFRTAGGLRDRGVVIVSARIDDTELPTDLQSYLSVDLRGDFEAGLDKLAKRIKAAGEIDLGQLDAAMFEALVGDLLASLQFDIVQAGNTGSRELGYDFQGSYQSLDPFGANETSEWFVEVKHHRHGRLSVNVLHDLMARGVELPAHARMLVVTSGLLTSVARNFVTRQETKTARPLRVVDGTELKALLLRFPELADKYSAPLDGA